MKKSIDMKVKSHLKKDNKDCLKENKEHNELVKKINKSEKRKK